MRKKILLVELETHEKNLNEYYKIFNLKFDTHVFVTKKIKKNLTISNDKIISPNYHKLINYFLVLFHIRKFDYVYFPSFLEYELYQKNILNYLNFFIKYFSFFLIIFLFKNKIIIKVVNIFHFFKIKNYKYNFFCKLRLFLLKKTNRFLMETKHLTNNLKKNFQINQIENKNFTCLYIAHTNTDKPLQNNSDYLKIGLLGEINETRKNYDIILDALNKIANKKIHIYFLGTNLDQASKKIIEKFKKFKTFFPSGYLSDDIFYEWGKNCDLLISTNKTDFVKGYGSLKGTGAFGDAIYLSKPLLILSNVDPIKEFNDFAFYYDNNEDFSIKFKKILDENSYSNVSFRKYNFSDNINRIVEELNL